MGIAAIVIVLLVVAISIPGSSSWCHDVSYSTTTAMARMNVLSTASKHSRRQGMIHPTIGSRQHHDVAYNALHSHTASAVHSTINAESSSTPNKASSKSQRHHLHLLSLPHPTPTGNETDVAPKPPVESLLQKCWSWKTAALGDGANHMVPRRQRRRRRGRIEFIPRSTAIRQFQLLFVGMQISVVADDAGVTFVLRNGQTSNEMVMPIPFNVSSEFSHFEETFAVEECSVLSTCARMNAILVLRSISPATSNNDSSTKINDSYTQTKVQEMAAAIASRYAVACTLHQQIQSSRQHTKVQRNEVIQIADNLTHLEGAHSISSHLSLVASGLAHRPDRPNDEVIFRPYSSSDAHILMQLKRTVEMISVRDNITPQQHDSSYRQRQKRKISKRRKKSTVGPSLGSSSRGRIKVLLDGALRAGKMARNEGIVPEITRLKQFCSDDEIPPKELSIPAVEAVMERAITPSVSSCVARLAAMESGTSLQISRLRQQVNIIVDQLVEQNISASMRRSNVNIVHDGTARKYGPRLRQLANKLLHKPTMQLRQGKFSDDEIEDAVFGIEQRLKEHCLDDTSLSI
mmetsp:Transcript_8005/g.18064  ORF Transcript_8005/g.18064 Transcript_8005/m.18064 type:complete len:575 (-) Transcript_8005:25-1749(-)